MELFNFFLTRHCIQKFLLLVILCAMSIPGPCYPEAGIESLSAADEHYKNRTEPAELQEAIRIYEGLSTGKNPAFEAAWKLSRAYWYMGNQSTGDEKKRFFIQGMEAGNRAITIDANKCEGHLWTGINRALLADSSGALKALGMVDEVKQDIEKSMDLNENCECGAPQRVLGNLYAKLPWFKGGSKKQAIHFLVRSLELCPGDTQSRIFLAEIYLDQNSRALASEQLEIIMSQEPDPQWIPETNENKLRAQKMLLQIKKTK